MTVDEIAGKVRRGRAVTVAIMAAQGDRERAPSNSAVDNAAR
jgi:hypothetical protein